MATGDKQKVRLMLGTGPNRVDVGECEIEEMPDGSFQINASFDSPSLPGNIVATIPSLPWEARD